MLWKGIIVIFFSLRPFNLILTLTYVFCTTFVLVFQTDSVFSFLMKSQTYRVATGKLVLHEIKRKASFFNLF